ncbi:hypothetical protein [Kitasatospora cineracea]|uniref:hypothetical protein n=1 Tax=Kitasatospora cineracea TaxID=88074 RepID=UPI0033FAC339
MIMDRTAQVVPTRYKSADVRKQMGRLIAGADADDLLAAFLWTTEGWMLRYFFGDYDAQHERAEQENADARWHRLADWPDDLRPTPKAVKDAVDAAFLALETALNREKNLLREGREACRSAYLAMNHE